MVEPQNDNENEDSVVVISSQLIDIVAFSSLLRTSELVEVPNPEARG